MEYEIVRSSRRSLCIQIDNNGVVHIKAPFHTNEKVVADFISRKEQWIQNHLKRISFKNTEEKDYYKKYLYLKGQKIQIVNTGINIKSCEDNYICIPKNYTKDKLNNYFKEKAKKYNQELVYKLNANIKGNITSLKITSATKKWGSCNQKGQVLLNYRIIFLPEYLAEYIVVHELCHLKQLNHSSAFWELVEANCKDCKHKRKLLKQFTFMLNY